MRRIGHFCNPGFTASYCFARDERLLRGEHRAVAGARMVGMTMRDHSLVHGPCGVDIETADFAVHAGGRGQVGRIGWRYGVIGAMTDEWVATAVIRWSCCHLLVRS